jgi:hypothetical protein
LLIHVMFLSEGNGGQAHRQSSAGGAGP